MGWSGPHTAGFVLTGGHSTRMGRDKALLQFDGTTLLERTARVVQEAAGGVTVIGAPERYAHLGFPCISDVVPDCGPLGGLYTALATTHTEWNLLTACDMPALTAAFLSELLTAARARNPTCLVPATSDGLHPLCAVYHRRALAAVKDAIESKCFKMHDLLKVLNAEPWPVADASLLENVNTPVEWSSR
jgi:molybdenum cofactor guanylyltransferase